MLYFFVFCQMITGAYVIYKGIYSPSKSLQEIFDFSNQPTRVELMKRSYSSGLSSGLLAANFISAVGVIYFVNNA